MFDTMTLTKAGGGFCGAFLAFLLGGWASELIYHSGGGHGHGDDHARGYQIEVASADAEEAVVEEVDIEALFAAADAAAGEGVWRACSACHQLEAGANGVGPYLYGVVGRDIGSAEGYGSYSGALSEAGDVWTPENLYYFLENPKGWAPGTSMGYNGMRKAEDRVNLIAYLDSLDD